MSEDLPESPCDKSASTLPETCRTAITYLPQNENVEPVDGRISYYIGTMSERIPGVIMKYALKGGFQALSIITGVGRCLYLVCRRGQPEVVLRRHGFNIGSGVLRKHGRIGIE